MPFINEYVSEDDVEKYKLVELWLKYHPGRKSVPEGLDFHWTVDKKNNMYFKIVSSGREELFNTKICILFIDGNEIEFELEQADSYMDAGDTLVKVWELIRIKPAMQEEKKQSVLSVLRDALAAYGVAGIASHNNNYKIKFKNI